MTTKPGPGVNPSPAESSEKLAYESVAAIPTVEPNDRNRLGYHVWRWLSSREGTIGEVVRESGARLKIPADEAVRLISAYLASKGISSP